MNTILFEKLIKEEESNTLDFKKEFYDFTGINKIEREKKQTSFIKDILAFANTIRDKSAFIIIGIEDQTKNLIGMSALHDGNELSTVLENRLDIISEYHYENFKYDSKDFGIIEIPVKSYSLPCRAKKDIGTKIKQKVTYIRRDQSIGEATREEELNIIEWFNYIKNEKNISINEQKTLCDLDISIIDCKWIDEHLVIDAKIYPKLKKLTFPFISFKIHNSGNKPINDINIVFHYYFPLSMNNTLDLYFNGNKLSENSILHYNSFPPSELGDLKLFRLKIEMSWKDNYTLKQYKSDYYYEFSTYGNKLQFTPLDSVLNFHKDRVFDRTDYTLITPKDFKFHKSSFIKDFY